jgi:hypothetical protein
VTYAYTVNAISQTMYVVYPTVHIVSTLGQQWVFWRGSLGLEL